MKKSTLEDFQRRMDKSGEKSGLDSSVSSYPKKRSIDYGLFLIVFTLICYGGVMLFSASMTTGFATENNPEHFISKHLIFTAVGSIIGLFIAIVIPIKFFDRLWMSIFLYGFTSVILIAVLIKSDNSSVTGVNIGGATRWLNFFGLSFQPTEIAKFALVFCYAGYVSWLSKRRAKGKLIRKNVISQAFFDGFIDIVLPSLLILVWLLIILFQPHISCIVIMVMMSSFMFFASGIKWKSWLTGIFLLLIIIALIFSIVLVLKPMLPEQIQNFVNFDYVKTRLNIFTDIDSVDADASFQTRQSINAIGSGGIFGVGFGSSIQKWGYLPMQYNDYIFSVIAEELGLLGAGTVLILFTAYLIMGVNVAKKAANIHGMLIAFGFSIYITIQAFLNIAVATDLIPPTGITLPFFSYGGTSTVIFILCVGFLLCVSKSGITTKLRRTYD